MFRNLGLALLCAFSVQAFAVSKNILLTGYWSPSNDMLRRFSPNPEQNPEGWIGRNYMNSGYDVYAYFPEFPKESGTVGVGNFRVDFASAYNDFMRVTADLQPVAIVSFGVAGGPWEIEAQDLASFQKMFSSGNIPSVVGEVIRYPIPESLKAPVSYRSSLPLELIRDKVNTLPAPRAWIDQTQGAGTYLCAFTAYLGGWYHNEHSDPNDPAYNAMAGFIHINTSKEDGERAVHMTLEAIVETLKASQQIATLPGQS